MQLNAAVRALLFTPVENRVAPGRAEAVAFSVAVSDGVLGEAAVVTVDSLSVDAAPTVLAVSARSAQDGAPLAIVLAAHDPGGDDVSLVITATPAHSTLYLDATLLRPLLPGTRLPLVGNTALVYFRPEAGWTGDTGFSYDRLPPLRRRCCHAQRW